MNYLRQTIRNILTEILQLERKDQPELKGSKKILGEPDLSDEEDRDNPEYEPPEETELAEFSAVGAGGASSGKIRGWSSPMDYEYPDDAVGIADIRKSKKKKKK